MLQPNTTILITLLVNAAAKSLKSMQKLISSLVNAAAKSLKKNAKFNQFTANIALISPVISYTEKMIYY